MKEKFNILILESLNIFQEISSLCVEPCEGETLIITVFEIDKSEVPELVVSLLYETV